MIIILKESVTEEQIQHVAEKVEQLGLQPSISRGTYRTVIGVIGDESILQSAPLGAIPGVAEVIPVMPAYKLASRQAHPKPTIVEVGAAKVKIGGGNLGMIAGPCAVEAAERMDAIAGAIRQAGANILRGGAFKPRTSPYSFQGLGEEGLKILRETGDRHGLPVVTEAVDPRHVDLICQYADMIQLGARNMQNFVLLTEVGRTNKPVLLKRGMSATIKDLLMSAEYIVAQGNSNVVLCERGVKGFDPAVRNTFDVAAVPQVHELSHLPIIVDPSHATGRPELIPACALAGVAAGADGVHIEVHDKPEEAMSDGPQALVPDQYAELMAQIRKLAVVMGKTISAAGKGNNHEGATTRRGGADMRKKLIAGNWKMNTDAKSANALARRISEESPAYGAVDMVVCPPSVYLQLVGEALAGGDVAFGAQNMYHAPNGAFTGEISAAMVKDVGATYVILGHSERRQFMGETDLDVNQKLLAAHAAGLTPIVCVGETLRQREAGQTAEVICGQFAGSLAGLSAGQMAATVIAYEPVWAIGTGKVATPQQAQEVHADLRKLVADRYNAETAELVRILYGGSVKPDNAVELLGQPNIDGALVGGASLKAEDFLAIAAAGVQLAPDDVDRPQAR